MAFFFPLYRVHGCLLCDFLLFFVHYSRIYSGTFLKKVLLLRFPPFFPSFVISGKRPRRNQRRNNRSSPLGEIRTKERPKNSKIQKKLFIKIALSFISLIPCLIPPTDDRETTERIPKEDLMTKKALFLRLSP